MFTPNRIMETWRSIREYGNPGLIVSGDQLQMERLFLALKIMLVPLPPMLLIWAGPDVLPEIIVIMIFYASFTILSYLCLRFVRVWKRQYSDTMRFAELLTAGVLLTITHNIVGSFEYNVCYLIVIILGVLTGGLRTAVMMLSLSFPVMLFSNLLMALISKGTTKLGALLNALAHEGIFIIIAFISLWVVSQSNRYRIEAEVDGLTGLYNHRHFYQELNNLLKVKTPHNITVVLTDIDEFKQINDRFGHLTGDEVLRKIGHLLRDHLPEPHTVARYGGEEFAFILQGLSSAEVQQKLEDIQTAIASLTFTEDENTLTGITMSYGVIHGITNDLSSAKWVQITDHALYKAKQTGKNRVEYADNPR